jgi:hypothetical protein
MEENIILVITAFSFISHLRDHFCKNEEVGGKISKYLTVFR